MNNGADPRPMLTTTDLARRLGMTTASLRSRIKRYPDSFPPVIRPVHKMMFDPDDVDAWLEDLKAQERARNAADRAYRQRVQDAIGR